jgi:hypothetical protein
MPIATDPLSLLFIACFLFGFLFFVITAMLGNLGHGHAHTHVGDHSVSHHTGLHAPGGEHVAGAHVSGHSVSSNIGGRGTGGTQGTTHAQAAGHTAHAQAAVNHQSFLSTVWTFINPTSVILFLFGFGFFGYVFHNTANLALPFSLLLAAVGGVFIAAIILALLTRVFGDAEANTIQDVSDRTGLLGKVSLTIQASGVGEILYTSPGGMRKSIPARSIDGRRIERDEEVVVLDYQHGIAEVDTWEHFINEERHVETQAPAMNEDDLAKLRALLEESGTTNTGMVVRNDLQKE